MGMWGRRGRGVVMAGVAVILIAGCSGGGGEGANVAAATSSSAPPPPKPVTLTLALNNGAVDVSPGLPVIATAADGKLTEVKLTNPEGKVVEGKMNPESTQWTNTEPLGYAKTYKLVATATGEDGKPQTKESSFTTVKPRTLTYVSTNPMDGTTIGVGQPLAFYFDEPVADKVAAEKMLEITTEPKVEGAFYWFNKKEVHWRPEKFWKPGTKITMHIKVYGKHVGDGIYGQEDRTITTTVGDEVIHEADGQTHQVITKVNGQVVRTMPTSMGKPADATPTGTYVLMEKHSHMIMDSTTYGLALENGGYRTPVDWAYRMSNSGIFFHSAPWSIGDQGRRNVSHGCLNLSPENAKWVFDNSKQGDVVIVKNSGGPVLEPWDGFGDWQVPWTQWVQGNR
ncbi:peptidoglycan transpeptidase precursor (ErfK-YbiS-YhnG family) [Lentzea atacamensis]|uniref:Peptidoglycan transpeptidase (ErfK-YbiS-YhnG family) n=1 Tax=Lentzea atacamensis TaxID=531938 RepID=A0ABX9E5Y5_9PSEU|nr:peptidoglycan transpeptidase precursor (ErfK-YbiS-YhnG family) [Lentzea atacamensis]